MSGAPGAIGFFWSAESHECPSEIKHWDLQRTNFNWKYNIQSDDISIFCTDNTDHPHHPENDIDLDWALDSVEEEDPEEDSWIDGWLKKLKENGKNFACRQTFDFYTYSQLDISCRYCFRRKCSEIFIGIEICGS